jgi:hypothetical protein
LDKDQAIDAIESLIMSGFIVPVSAKDQISISDQLINEEDQEIDKQAGPLTDFEKKKLKKELLVKRKNEELYGNSIMVAFFNLEKKSFKYF